jgi:hypothetical protein
MVGIKLIAIDDSDPDFMEYIKPRTSAGNKANAKVGGLSIVYDYKAADPWQQQVAVWDSDPDFIEYESSPAKPERPKSKKPSKPSTVSQSRVVKLEPATSGSLVASASTTDAGSVSGLPEFVRANWVGRFLPTLYHCFGSSKEPWNMFTKGREMLLIIQKVINEVYPDTNYRVKWGDKICTAVYFPLSFFATHFNFF